MGREGSMEGIGLAVGSDLPGTNSRPEVSSESSRLSQGRGDVPSIGPDSGLDLDDKQVELLLDSYSLRPQRLTDVADDENGVKTTFGQVIERLNRNEEMLIVNPDDIVDYIDGQAVTLSQFQKYLDGFRHSAEK